ncbi:MAG: MFS transporter, partial [Ignavibacteriae bacterium]|nr:MFS transporter [Ignavibacteriota bacterium]
AWISNISAKKDTATAIGTYSAFQSIFTMIASSFAGLIWFKFGASATFIVTGVATVIIIGYFLLGLKTYKIVEL